VLRPLLVDAPTKPERRLLELMAAGLHELTHRARRRGSAADPWAGLWLGRERFGSTIRALLRADPLRADADICSPVAAWHNPGNRAACTLAAVEGMIGIRADARHLLACASRSRATP
jgi:hypothetical protein